MARPRVRVFANGCSKKMGAPIRRLASGASTRTVADSNHSMVMELNETANNYTKLPWRARQIIIPRVLFLSFRNLSLYVNRRAEEGFARELRPHFRAQAFSPWDHGDFAPTRSGASLCRCCCTQYGPCHKSHQLVHSPFSAAVVSCGSFSVVRRLPHQFICCKEHARLATALIKN
jgi:hypothetical protein